MFFPNRETTVSFLLLIIYELFLFIHVSVASTFPDGHPALCLSSQSCTEFLQTKHDNRRDFHVKEMSICDIHVDSMSKLHQISINSKFKFSLEYATSGVVTWKSQGHVKFDELCFGGESIRH